MQIIQSIQNRIYEIRGQKVMLDFDLAALYGVETRVMNQAVKRNASRFPKDFMFRITANEWKNFPSSQNVMMENLPRNRTAKYLPYAFTEHGVTMLANVLKSRKAIKMSIAVVRAFISLKQMAMQHKGLAAMLEELRSELHERIGEHDAQLAAIYKAIESLLDDKAAQRKWEDREKIGFST
ncbi:MAG: ORF6N domain-containing protein [Ferruginibacter sp.]|nr:ORF6N domain-containing protein [Ferruginibacter sp.]MBU9935179.1 ORF6N domain-containing protein [Ferruginibacter sp.]